MTTWRLGTAGLGSKASLDGIALDSTELYDAGAAEAEYLTSYVADVEPWLGPELTAYLAGADSPAELDRWSKKSDGTEASAAGRRLRAANEVVETFAAVGHGTDAQAWLREMSPQTAGHCPAYLVRHARNELILDQVREAAKQYLRPLAAA